MLNNVPFNVNVPEFQPERSSPIFPQITRKYPCIEDVVTSAPGDPARFGTLTWKIQQPDRSMVWTSVKLVLPLKMQAYRQHVAGGYNMPHPAARLDMGVAGRLPACNIAVAESPMSAFRQSSMTINGRIFSEVNNFRKILDTCYRGTGPSSYGDNHSLKPIVCRDLKGMQHDKLSVYTNAGSGANPIHTGVSHLGRAMYVQIDEIQAKTIDSAFSLLEHNGPFLERARKFQDELSSDGETWQGLITNYLELGPFQARARKGNTAVPYIRDFHLRLNYDTNPSRFDSKVPTNVDSVIPVASCRVIPSKLFEFGTVANLLHHNESVIRLNNFITGMVLQYTEKPYLEITYTRFIEPQKPFYNLRCFEHQYEQSNPFTLVPIAHDRVSPTTLQRVTSRLLSYPTKIYVYADFADYEQFPWGLGGVRRSCMLKNLHCRVNQRPDIVFNPSQEECYEMFRRHTNSSLEFGAWLKSPIYCFDPVDLGQPDMFANDARLTLMEWDAEVSLTPLQIQENTDVKHLAYLSAMGYKENPTTKNVFDGPPEHVMEWASGLKGALAPGDTDYWILLNHVLASHGSTQNAWIQNLAIPALKDKTFQFQNAFRFPGPPLVTPTTEVFRPTTCTRVLQQYRGMVWGAMNPHTGTILNNTLYYVPQSWWFAPANAYNSCIVPWTSLVTTVVATGGDDTYTYNVLAPYRNSGFFQRDYETSAKAGQPFNATNAAPANDDHASPGYRAYITDRYGLRNQNTAGTAAYLNPGRHIAGSAGYPEINQKTTTHKWVCFGHSFDMFNGAGDDGLIFRWRSTNTAYGDQIAGERTDFLCGEDCLAVKGVMDRNVFLDEMPGIQVNMQLATIPKIGPKIGEMTFDSYSSQNNFDYTMKVLYEYGNSQYQFTADGAPTKVLPNLVPVGPSAGISMLQ